MSDKSGFELVREYAEREGSEYEVACQLLHDLRVGAKAEAALAPVIAWAVGTVRRQEDRALQAPLRRARRKGMGVTVDPIAERKLALDTMLRLGAGERVRLGAATVEQHRTYIAMLERNVAGLNDTIRFHETSIAEIEAAGVSCLDELYALVTV